MSESSIQAILDWNVALSLLLVRDAWEAKKPEYETEISTALGTAWTIETNVNLIYVYADDSYKDRVGTVITW